MLLQQEARHLISTKAPMSEEQLKIVMLIDEGIPVESVAERLGEPLDSIKSIIDEVVEEFGAYMAG